ncbi:MAG: bifunctional serine/threonine-protein kinase/formylglycine-generating enzyme family protein, partial [Planctomycetota bacterium]
MDELRKEERLFVELCRKRGALTEPVLAKARETARAKGVSVVEALITANALSDEHADAVRKELMGLSFTCAECENLDFRELDEPKVKGRRCGDCLASEAQTGVQPAKQPAPPRRDTIGAQATEVGPDAAAPAGAIVRPPGGGEELAEGVVLGGCRIQRRIGQGGMGRVYKGHHDGLDRDMAIKVIDEKLVAKKGFAEQFLAEARTLAKLDHPNIVRVFNVDTDMTGRHFIVMELLEGGSVESLWRDSNQKLSVDEAVRITREAAEGLLHAHEAGLIHRDVKPGNLMLTKDGRVKVVDFGLAARTENDVFIATEIAGTPSYMAPEQVDGLRLDARCDQYALGASLFQLVCGRPPFVAKRAFEILSAHMNEAPVAPSALRDDLPPWLDAAVLRMLAKRPGDRFPSLSDAVAALAPEDAAAPPPPPTAPSRPPINSAEIVKLEKGLRPRPVAPPAWRPAVAAMAACAAAAALFILIPARDAFGGADLGLGEVPGFVQRLDRDLRAKVASNRAEDYASALETVEQAIADLKAGPGAATLATLRDGLTASRKALALKTDDALSKQVAALLAADRLGAILDLADPSSTTLGALGLEARVKTWRASAIEALGQRGEVYVPSGPQGRGFYLDRTEVTNEDWAKAVASAGLERPASWPAGPLPKTLARKPVTGVTIEQARRYAKAVGKRLPTSAEWERAARGADGRAWPWGPRFEPGRANLLDGGAGALEDVDARATDDSPHGALGMAGNAMEWVEGLDWPLA